MTHLLRLSLFLVSSLGFVRFFVRRLKYNPRLAWIAVFTMNVLVVYLGALAGFLVQTSLAMFSVGLLLFAYELATGGKEFVLRLFKPDFVKVLMGFYLIIFAITLLKTTLVHFDNFSHWALIVKFLIVEGRLPVATDVIISFSSYPMGASLFVYYFTLIGGYNEGVMILGQFVFVMAALYAMFAVIRDDKRILVTTILFTIIAIMNHFNVAIRHNNLLVDFVLPVLALASIAGTYVYRRDIKRMSFHNILVLGTLVIVKNSAFFFVGIALVYYIYVVFRYNKKLSSVAYVIITIAIIMIPYILWKIRLDTVFADVASKHSVNASAYKEIFEAKSPETLKLLTTTYLKASTDIHSLAFQGVLLVNGFFILLYVVMKYILKHRMRSVFTFLSVNLMFLIYYVGIFLMFVFSMPLEEAMELAGFERYASSIVIMGLGIFGMYAVLNIDKMFYVQDIEIRNQKAFKNVLNKTVYQYTTMLLLFVSITLILSENNGMLYNSKQSLDALPAQIKAVAGDRMTYNDRKVLLVASDEQGEISNYYAQFAGRYYLFTNNVDAYPKYEMENSEFIAILKKYDYIIMPNKNYTFIEKIRQTTGMTVDKSVYTTEEILSKLK